MRTDVCDFMALDLRGPDVPLPVRAIGLDSEQASACADKKGNAILVGHGAIASDERLEGLHIDL
jgi:hypothetical protein